jgi:hypothetical protein
MHHNELTEPLVLQFDNLVNWENCGRSKAADQSPDENSQGFFEIWQSMEIAFTTMFSFPDPMALLRGAVALRWGWLSVEVRHSSV